MSAEGGSEEAVRARVSAAWTKWRELSGVFFELSGVFLLSIRISVVSRTNAILVVNYKILHINVHTPKYIYINGKKY